MSYVRKSENKCKIIVSKCFISKIEEYTALFITSIKVNFEFIAYFTAFKYI